MSNRYERYQYIYGNTARTVEQVVPEREEQKPQKQQQPVREPKKRTVVRRHRGLEFNSRFTMSLTMSVAAMVFICVGYLYGQCQLNNQISRISKKRTELTTLIQENHAHKSNLDKTVDYDEIKKYASEKMGMVVPDEKSTIYYESAAADYVRQYEDIPQAQ